jgi:hypothetical protein
MVERERGGADVTSPDDALDTARERAAAAGGAPADDGGFTVEPVSRVGAEHLVDWALIEPRQDQMYSTRRLGAPVTLLKRLVSRALRQQQNQLSSEQTRFNLGVVAYVRELERRIGELEAELRRRGGPPEAP